MRDLVSQPEWNQLRIEPQSLSLWISDAGKMLQADESNTLSVNHKLTSIGSTHSHHEHDVDVGIDLGSHVSVRLGVNNILDRQPPIIGFNANPLLVNGNMLSSTYDTFGRYLFVGLTAKY